MPPAQPGLQSGTWNTFRHGGPLVTALFVCPLVKFFVLKRKLVHINITYLQSKLDLLFKFIKIIIKVFMLHFL